MLKSLLKSFGGRLVLVVSVCLLENFKFIFFSLSLVQYLYLFLMMLKIITTTATAWWPLLPTFKPSTFRHYTMYHHRLQFCCPIFINNHVFLDDVVTQVEAAWYQECVFFLLHTTPSVYSVKPEESRLIKQASSS